MNEPLSLQLLSFLDAQKQAPVKGVSIIKKTKQRSPLDLSHKTVVLRGSEYHLKLPWGTGISVRYYGIWSVVMPELLGNLRAKKEDIELIVPAMHDLKITYRGSEWIVCLDRDYAKIALSAQVKKVSSKLARYGLYFALAILGHFLLYGLITYVPYRPLEWIDKTILDSNHQSTLEDQIIREAQQSAVAERATGSAVKVKFNFFNGLPWAGENTLRDHEVKRLDSLLKELKSSGLGIQYDASIKRIGNQKSTLLSKLESVSPTIQATKQSEVAGGGRVLTPTELKRIRSSFQALAPEMSLSYERALVKNPELAFGLRYEAMVNASGFLSQIKFVTSGVQNPQGLSELLEDLKRLFESKALGKDLSGVTVQGENIFKNR